jgi:hypothetical protein
MTKIAERMFLDEGKLVIQSTHDFTPVAEKAKTLNRHGMDSLGESKLVALIPDEMVNQWLKEAGVRWDDREGVEKVLARKLNDPDFSHFRVWGGRF